MTYEMVLERIHARRTFSTGGPTLNRIRKLMDSLGNPQDQYKTIHVAGTNGKGSTCAMIEQILRSSGARTGLFTSPYLCDFCERIRICGELIDHNELVSCYELVESKEQRIVKSGWEPLNEFELVTAIGFVAFKRAGVEYAVIEVGLGGRTDPTNIITSPVVSCITPISLDHTAVLGNTVEEIAVEKCGIIKEHSSVIAAPQAPSVQTIIQNAADALCCSMKQLNPPSILARSKNGLTFECSGQSYTIPMIGDHQAANALVAIYACREMKISEEAITEGLRHISWPGRLQIINKEHLYLIDAGHNIAGIETICDAIDSYFYGVRVITVMAMMKDKEYESCIQRISTKSHFLIGTTVGLPRSLSPESIKTIAQRYCCADQRPDVTDALTYASGIADTTDVILVCGSVYAAGEALKILQ